MKELEEKIRELVDRMLRGFDTDTEGSIDYNNAYRELLELIQKEKEQAVRGFVDKIRGVSDYYTESFFEEIMGEYIKQLRGEKK